MSYATYLINRVVFGVIIVLAVLTINFLLLQLTPGDVVDVLVGEMGSASPQYIAELRTKFGLDQSAFVQLWRYLSAAVEFDLGYSFRNAMPVSSLIAQRLVPTLVLLATSTTLALLIGISAGIVAARYVNRFADTVIMTVALLFYATPLFWIGLLMIVVFSVSLGWLPSGGFEQIGAGLTGFARIRDIAWHVIMPAIALALLDIAIFARLTRASLLETLNQDYIRTARAKGLTEFRVLIRHALRNALLPVVTMAGLQIAALVSGAVVTETVFSWPGLGRLAYEAITNRDYNLLLGVLYISATLVVVLNILVDVLYGWLDPRIKVS
jgi:peptide/nickel transport system permease protein